MPYETWRSYIPAIAELDSAAQWHIVVGPDGIRIEIAANGGLLKPTGFNVGDERDDE